MESLTAAPAPARDDRPREVRSFSGRRTRPRCRPPPRPTLSLRPRRWKTFLSGTGGATFSSHVEIPELLKKTD